MADTYPEDLVFDLHSRTVADYFNLDSLGQPLFDISNTDDQITTYRFASKPRGGTIYITFDRNEV